MFLYVYIYLLRANTCEKDFILFVLIKRLVWCVFACFKVYNYCTIGNNMAQIKVLAANIIQLYACIVYVLSWPCLVHLLYIIVFKLALLCSFLGHFPHETNVLVARIVLFYVCNISLLLCPVLYVFCMFKYLF